MKRKFWYYAIKALRWLRGRANKLHLALCEMTIQAEDHYLDAAWRDAKGGEA